MSWGGLAFLMLVWLAASGDASPAMLLLGLAFSVSALAVSGRLKKAERGPGSLLLRGRVRAWAVLGVVFVYELVKANFMVAGHVVRPRLRLRPGILEYPLRLRDEGAIALFLSLITLTPGIVVLGVSNDKARVYVHAIDARDLADVRDSVLRLEQCVLEVGA